MDKLKYLELNSDVCKFSEKVKTLKNRIGNIYIKELPIKELENELNELYLRFKNIFFWYKIFDKYHIKKQLANIQTNFDSIVIRKHRLNDEYFEKRRKELPNELKIVNNRELDKNQLNSILLNERNILVIAGAGTGKTTTIVGKIKHLLLKEKVDKSKILLLTYTNNASEEMKKRIFEETGQNLDVFTFHKLGKNIITQVDKKVPTITNIDLKKFIRDSISKLINDDKSYQKKLSQYLFFNQYLSKSKFDFDKEEDYLEHIKLNPLITLKNEVVKSYEELIIANFLTLNGIKYEYEKKYVIDTSDSEYGQYNPDFYISEYDIWLEHFGISEKGEVPKFFSGKDGLSAKETYNNSIKWKREVHKENKTKLIETYSYENSKGVLRQKLKDKLKKEGIEFKEVDYKKVIHDFIEENKSIYNGLNELFSTVINLLRINRIDRDQFLKIDMNIKESNLRDLILPIYSNYIQLLKSSNEIDFSDMLNIAIEYINKGKYKSQYEYVIIDEFQDISKITYEFLMSLRKSRNYNLFAVGDDWQSIYRFAGSDIGYITNFSRYFGNKELFFISNTYRYSQTIADVSGYFVMNNPNQIYKEIKSQRESYSFDVGLIEGYTEEYTMQFMENKLNELPSNAEVLFLSRYNYDINYLNKSFNYYFDNAKRVWKVVYNQRRDLNIVFRSIHAAKGLEADYVFILNNKKGNYGFPSTIQDNSILNYFLSSSDDFPYSEERRLMYVALTRAKKQVWLVLNKNQRSIFIDELENRYKREFERERFQCPKCNGKLIKKKGPYGIFLGCSNYPDCTCTRNINKK